VSDKIRAIQNEISEEQSKEIGTIPLDGINTIERAKTCMRAFFEIILKIRVDKV